VAVDRSRQRATALLTLVIAGALDVLFLVLNELPATVPIALSLIAIEAIGAYRRRGARLGRPRSERGKDAGGEAVAALPRTSEDAASRL
jgi:hypothetical protein